MSGFKTTRQMSDKGWAKKEKQVAEMEIDDWD